MENDDAEQFSKFYRCREIITAENFTKVLHYYKIAKKYYEENAKVLENSPHSEFYREKNKVVLSHLKIIEDILSEYDPNYKKESSKEEKKEIAEKKNNKKEESKRRKLIGKEIEKKDI